MVSGFKNSGFRIIKAPRVRTISPNKSNPKSYRGLSFSTYGGAVLGAEGDGFEV